MQALILTCRRAFRQLSKKLNDSIAAFNGKRELHLVNDHATKVVIFAALSLLADPKNNPNKTNEQAAQKIKKLISLCDTTLKEIRSEKLESPTQVELSALEITPKN